MYNRWKSLNKKLKSSFWTLPSLIPSQQLFLLYSLYFCVFKYARKVKQKVLSKAENGEWDWGETPKIRVTVCFAYVIFVWITRFFQPQAVPISESLMKAVNKLSNYVSNESFAMFPPVMNSLSVGMSSFSLICESIAAQV